jgi:hypothetical protein
MKPVYGNGLFVIASWYRSFPIARGWNSLAVGNNTFVIVSDQNVTTGGTGPIGTSLISTNGITWVEKSLNNGLSNSWWNGLFFGNNKFLVFAGITSQIVAILSPSSLGTAKDLLPSLIENIVPVKNGFVTGSSMVGIGASADRYGMRAGASGFFTSTGDAQAVQFVLRNKTTNATPTTLFLDGVSTRLTIPSGKALFAHVIIAGIRSDGVTAAHYQRKVGIKNVGGTTSLLDTQPSIIGTDFENTAGYDVTITADDTNDALQINVTGAASETIRWVAVVDGVEIRYGT